MKGLLTVIISSILIISCSDSSTNPSDQNQTGQIWPLAMGNLWNNHLVSFNQDGSVNGSFDFPTEVIKDTVINSVHWYGLSTNTQGLLANKSDGLWTYWIETTIGGLFLKYPCNINDRWNYVQPLFEGNVTVKSLSEDVVINNVTHSCILYELIDNQNILRERIYVRPGVGIVKDAAYDNGGNLIMEMTLQTYTIN